MVEVKSMKILFTEEEIEKRICALGAQITKDYAGKEIKMIGVLRGASVFFTELAKRIELPVRFDFLSMSSYGDKTESGGQILIRKEPDEPVKGEHVILVEDIIDTGRTLKELLKLFADKGAASTAMAALLDKPSRRVTDVKADYVGFEIPDAFVVGYGLDYAQYYRNLPYIGVVEV